MYIKIFSKDNCPFCEKALFQVMHFKKYLMNCSPAASPYVNEFDYKVYKLGDDFDMKDLVELFPNARTFPQISCEWMPKHVNGKDVEGEREIIGGYDNLVPWLEASREIVMKEQENYKKKHKIQ